MDIKQIIITKTQERKGRIIFQGDFNNSDDFTLTKHLAKNCLAYTQDVEEELYVENETTCLNCRYRRWDIDGFACLKGFPQN